MGLMDLWYEKVEKLLKKGNLPNNYPFNPCDEWRRGAEGWMVRDITVIALDEGIEYRFIMTNDREAEPRVLQYAVVHTPDEALSCRYLRLWKLDREGKLIIEHSTNQVWEQVSHDGVIEKIYRMVKGYAVEEGKI